MLVEAVTPVILIADTGLTDKDTKATKADTARVLEIMGGGKHSLFACRF